MVVLMDELPENWTYPLIQPKLIEKYLQIEKQSYSQIQQIAKQTIAYIKKIIKPGMKLLDIRKLCEKKLLELGADSFWYWDVGAFVFAGDETTVSVSGKQYVTSDKIIENNDKNIYFFSYLSKSFMVSIIFFEITFVFFSILFLSIIFFPHNLVINNFS